MTQDQRTAFEAWYATQTRQDHDWWGWDEEHDQYGMKHSRLSWSAWQAAIEHDRQQSGEPVAWRIRHRSEPGMIGHYPWSYTDRIRGGRDDMHYEYEPLFATPQPTAPVKPIEQRGESDVMRYMPEILAALKSTGHNVSLARDVETALSAHPQPAEPEWIDDPHDIEQGMMRNPKYKPAEPVKVVSARTRLRALHEAAQHKYKASCESYYEGQADAYDLAIQIVEEMSPVQLAASAEPSASIAEAWTKARNAWVAQNRHGTQENADEAAIAALQKALLAAPTPPNRQDPS